MMLSVIGQNARIIQAHVCTREQRLKVRYSQLCDLSYYTPVQIDPFVRWLLSDPITETKPIAEAAERAANYFSRRHCSSIDSFRRYQMPLNNKML
jgi:hypothetical protein